MKTRALWLVPALVLAGGQGIAQDPGRPMSAIDWLSDSLAEPIMVPDLAALAGEAPVDGGAITPDVTVTALDANSGPRPDAIGLLAPNVTGLPATLWGQSDAGVLAQLITAESADLSPALLELLYRVLLAELDPPIDNAGTGETLFLARVDKLLELGALDQAYALLQRAGPASAEITRRWFDAALLIGEEDEVCRAIEEAPDFSPTYPARIFCLARAGDWEGAVLLLGTARALDLITADEDALLARFLDPDLFEGEDPPAAPRRMTPLTFRLYEAIGEPIPTANLPVAFAQADLRANIGWKPQIDAGERLARTGAVSDNQLLGLYTNRRASASGGVWERVKAVQALEVALDAQDVDAVAAAIPTLWAELSAAETEVPISHIHGITLAGMSLPGAAGEIAFRMGLLTDGYEAIAQAAKPTKMEDQFLAAVAMGDLSKAIPPNNAARAVAEGFAQTAPAPRLANIARAGNLGEAILEAIALFNTGARGNPNDLSDAIGFFRAVGLEAVARRASLDYLILERRG